MRPRGPTLKVSDFPDFNSSNPNPAIRFALYSKRNGAQAIGQLWRDARPAQLPERQFHAHASGKSATAGRTNGMPWDGTSPISEATHVEITSARKPEKGLEALIVRLWALPMPGERMSALWALADELRPYSAEIAEDVRMLCGMTAQGVGQ